MSDALDKIRTAVRNRFSSFVYIKIGNFTINFISDMIISDHYNRKPDHSTRRKMH